MMIRYKWVLVLCLCSLSTLTAIGQEDFEEFKEIFTFYPNKKAAAEDSTLYKSKFIAAPVISYAPETSLGFGIGAKYLFKFKGSGEETRTSNMPMTLQYTLKNQFIVYSGFEVFTNQEKWVIEGNLLFQNFPRLFYGLGRDTPDSNEETYNFYQLTVEPIFLKQLFARYLFIGAGFRYNHIYKTEIVADGLLDTNEPLGYDGSTSVGAEFAVLYDSRNNILNAQNGWYLEFTHGLYGQVLGGEYNFELTRFDIRHFIRTSKKTNDVLGFQFIGHFLHKDAPLSEYALFGSSEILRGYKEGRYIDRNLLAGQVEYRKNFKNSRFGLVAFVGAGDVYTSLNDFKFSNLRPNYGVGLRFLLDQKENLNLRFDWGFGDSTNNVYLNIAEAF
ncbi:BamA/TamA family outer membrane protein [Aquimarina brevivitae]|uniref:Surface antigen-like protein n=1 Tax=Aquimarina brevivitae TaxID=323412 RepID=A0A4Q7NZK9_9FLAO|nr:BamA/TamA family outer membrane protein [Aquimarina brevivitae]RZS92448.1 surface antigen-like protein [Aquimarina brevivitae]